MQIKNGVTAQIGARRGKVHPQIDFYVCRCYLLDLRNGFTPIVTFIKVSNCAHIKWLEIKEHICPILKPETDSQFPYQVRHLSGNHLKAQ